MQNQSPHPFVHPKTQAPLTYNNGCYVSGIEQIGVMQNSIPRFVSYSTYSDNFGSQWNKFRKTQLDSYTGRSHSACRLARCLGLELNTLRGKLVLEAGCGAGRFTEVLLKYGAYVHSFDLSNAVEANLKNNRKSQNLTLAQADIMNMPFKHSAYDIVMCLGVLQHTPSPERSIESLWKMVRSGGILAFDHYHWNIRIGAPWPLGEAIPLYRRYLRNRSVEERWKLIKSWVDYWFPWHWKLKDNAFGRIVLSRISPVVFHYPCIELQSKEMYFEWALLDTHDATTDFFKHRRTEQQLIKYVKGLPGLASVSSRVAGNGVEITCSKY